MSKEELGGGLTEEIKSDPNFDQKIKILKELALLKKEKKGKAGEELEVIEKKIENLKLELTALKTKTTSPEADTATEENPETPTEPQAETVATDIVEEEKEMNVGETDSFGFKLVNKNENEKLGTKFLSYEYTYNGKLYRVEHTFYEGKDEGWKSAEEYVEESAEKIYSEYIRGTFKTQSEMKKAILEDIENKKRIESENMEKKKIAEWEEAAERRIAEVAELLKNEKVSQVVFHSRDQEDPGKDEQGEDKGLKIVPDNDARLANYIFNNLNKKSPEEIYAEGAMSSFIPKSGTKENLSIQNKGLRIFIDAGGKWLNVEKDGKEIVNLYIDHHGSGKRKATSATEMILKIMEKADLLKEKPEWLDNFVKLTTEIDNLSYIEEIKNKEANGFNTDYFKNKWPNSLYAIAEKMPFDTLLKLFEEKKITDPSKVFTKEELEGELGKTKTETTLKWFLSTKQKPSPETMEGLVKLGKIDNVNHVFSKEEIRGGLGETKIEITIAELCKAQKQRANEASFGVEEAERYMKDRKLNFKNTALGKVLFHNHFTKRFYKDGNPEQNKIHNDLAYLAARAHGYDTLVNLDEKNKRFFVNSWISVKKIADKFGLVDIRGNFIFGSTANEAGEVVIGEKELLDTIGPEMLEKSVERKEPKKPLTQEEQIEMLKKIPIDKLTPEQKKILLEYALKKREELNKKIEDKKNEILNLINEKDTKIAGIEKKYERPSSDDMSGFDEIPEPEEEITPATNTTDTTPENKIENNEKRDELFEQAAKLVVEHQHGSASLIQRKLQIGYNRAGQIIDQLENAGIIGPFEGNKAREVKFPNLPDLEEHLKKIQPQKPEYFFINI